MDQRTELTARTAQPAVHTMVTTGAMTKRIDRLERDGLVTRRRSAADGRGRVVALTPAGRNVIDQAFGAHMRNERDLLDTLSPEEAARLEALPTAWPARSNRRPAPDPRQTRPAPTHGEPGSHPDRLCSVGV